MKLANICGRGSGARKNRTILSTDKIGQFLHDRRQIFVGRRFSWQTKSANFIDLRWKHLLNLIVWDQMSAVRLVADGVRQQVVAVVSYVE